MTTVIASLPLPSSQSVSYIIMSYIRGAPVSWNNQSADVVLINLNLNITQAGHLVILLYRGFRGLALSTESSDIGFISEFELARSWSRSGYCNTATCSDFWTRIRAWFRPPLRCEFSPVTYMQQSHKHTPWEHCYGGKHGRDCTNSSA